MPHVTVSSVSGVCLEQNFKEDACVRDVKTRVKNKHGYPVAAQALQLLQEAQNKCLEDAQMLREPTALIETEDTPPPIELEETHMLVELTPPINLMLVVAYSRCSIPQEVLSCFRIFADDPSKLPMEGIRKLFRSAVEEKCKEEACKECDSEEGNTPLLVAVQAKEAPTRLALFDTLWEATAMTREEVSEEQWCEHTKRIQGIRCAILTDSNHREWTALHFAAEVGDSRLCRTLLQRGKESDTTTGELTKELLNVETRNRQTPFQVALAHNHLHAAALLYAWTDVDDRPPLVENIHSILQRIGMEIRHQTLGEALLEAAEGGSEDVVNVLLEDFTLARQDKAAMLLWKGTGSETAIVRAQKGKHLSIVRALAEAATASGVGTPPDAGVPSNDDLGRIATGGTAPVARLHTSELEWSDGNVSLR